MHKKAFTLIELILYSALVAIALIVLVPFAWNMVESAQKSAIQQEVSTQARYISEKLKYEIRAASGINTASSNFDSNLAANAALQLSLAGWSSNNPVIINVSSGKVQIKKGAAAAVALNSGDTTVTNLTFSNYTSGDNKTKNVSFTLTLSTTSGSGRYEFSESASLRSDAEIRSN